MSNYSGLKQDINNNIYENQTQQITGTVLNAILNEMTASLGAGYQFAGVATLGMNPGDPDQRVFYLAGEGIYTSFGGIQVPAGKLGVLKWDNRWTLQTIDGLGGGGANLTGYVSVASTDDLPDEGQPTLGYLCGTNLYLYVGEGGDTKEGKYQDCGSFRGPEGAYIQDIEQTETSHENGGRNTIKMTLSDGRSFNAYVHNGTTSSGLFPTVAALQAAYPNPVVGQYAFVGAGFPADIYVCTTAGTWTDSGEDYDGDNVDLTDYATKAEVNQLEAKVTNLKGKFYGFYPTAEDLPEGDEDGFAYVGDDSPYAVYNFQNGEWTDSGSVVTISGGTSFTPDDEDLSLDNSVLKFADRPYNSQTPDGLGCKILRKDATFESQVTATNTIYEIRYDFTLSANVSIPANCELRFNGGKIIGGGNTITLNKTLISGNGKFDGCEFAGTLINGEVLLSWFTDGMSANNDYSVDHTTALISAMKLTARKDKGWLNLERIPICIKQTIVITNAFGNIGMKGGNIFFLSTADRQALFDYQQASVYSGAYSHIVDFWAKYVGTVSNQGVKHENVCFIKKTDWSDTVFTYWRDIFIYDFTGYFMVNQTYLQEVTFQNISCYGVGGFFSNNSDQLFGETKGSGNIMHFLNCNLNGGISTGNKTNIHYLWDLHNVIEADLVNIVNQGRVPGSNIYPLRISCGSSIINSNITLDGFWVEYVDGHINGKILIEDATVVLTLKKHCPNKLEINGNYVTVKFENASGSYIGDVITQSIISDTANVDWQFDSALLAQFNGGEKYNKFRELADKGIIADFRNGISNYPAASVPLNLRTETKCDLLANYAGQITSAKKNRTKIYFSNENGIDILCFEDDPNTVGNPIGNIFIQTKDMLPSDGYSTLQGKAIHRECIYRATILVDVTEENLSSVYCRCGQLIDWPSTAFITPKVGDTAGTTTGWVRGGFTHSANSFAGYPYLGIMNCKLELAYCVWYWRNGVLNNDILVKNGVISCPNNTRRIWQMSSIPANKDNVTDMSDIIRGAKGIFVTPKNVYMYVNGAVRAIYDYNAKGGTTSQRPTLASGDVGFTYYDSTLGKTIVWNGTAWVNIDGTALS